MNYHDPHTNQCELEVQKIIHLQLLANQLPDAFIDQKRVTKSHVPAVNAPIKIDIPEGLPTIENEDVVDQSVLKIKILERKKEQITKMANRGEHSSRVFRCKSL